MKVNTILKYFNYLGDNEYKLKKGYTLLIGGDSFNHYCDDGNNLTFYEFEFNYTVGKDEEFKDKVELLYHGKALKFVIDRWMKCHIILLTVI